MREAVRAPLLEGTPRLGRAATRLRMRQRWVTRQEGAAGPIDGLHRSVFTCCIRINKYACLPCKFNQNLSPCHEEEHSCAFMLYAIQARKRCGFSGLCNTRYPSRVT